MFENLNLWQMLMKGGITTMLLMAISVLSWWIIIERAIKFARIKIDTKEFMDRVKKLLSKKDKEGAITLCQTTPGPVSAVVKEGITGWDGDRERAESTMQRTLNYEAERMQSMLGILGSIGNVTPFIGLFGTVIGIIKAFHDLSLSSGGGPSVVANGIAEALVATAAGLFVAVPAVIAYNFFVRTVDSIETQAINAASELIDIMDGK